MLYFIRNSITKQWMQVSAQHYTDYLILLESLDENQAWALEGAGVAMIREAA